MSRSLPVMMKLLLRYWLTVLVFVLSAIYLSMTMVPEPRWQIDDAQDWFNFIPFDDGSVRLFSSDRSQNKKTSLIRSWSREGKEQGTKELPGNVAEHEVIPGTSAILTSECTGESKGQIRCWDVQQGRLLYKFDLEVLQKTKHVPLVLPSWQGKTSILNAGLTQCISPDGRWGLHQAYGRMHLIDLKTHQIAQSLNQLGNWYSCRLDCTGERLLGIPDSFRTMMIVNPKTGRLVADLGYQPYGFAYDVTRDGKCFVTMRQKEANPTEYLFTWHRTTDGQVAREQTISLPRLGSAPRSFWRLYCIDDGSVVLFSNATAKRYSYLSDIVEYLEAASKMKWGMPWIHQTCYQGEFCIVRPSGSVERLDLGPGLQFGRVSADGKHYLMRFITDTPEGKPQFRYALYEYPLASRLPGILMYSLMVAGCAFMAQWVWRRGRKPRGGLPVLTGEQSR